MRDSTRRFIEASGVTSTMQNIIRLMTDAADGMQEEFFALEREWGDEIAQQIDPEVHRLLATEFGAEDIQ